MVMRYLIKIIILFYSLPVFSWTYLEAEKQLLSQNPQYQAQVLATEVSGLNYQNAKAVQLPSLTFQSGATRFLQEAGTSGYRLYFGPRVTLPLYQGGGLRFNKFLNEERQSAQMLMLELERLDKVQKLREAFAKALYAKNYLEVAQEIVERSQKNLRLVELRYQSGLEYRWVHLTAKKDLADDQMKLVEATMNQQNALVDLQALLGELPISQVTDLEEDGFFIETAQEIQLADVNIQNHPDYQLEVSKTRQNEHQVDISRSKRYPNMNLRADFVIIETNNNPVVPFWSAGFTMGMPLFEFGINKRNQEVALKQQQQQSLQTSQKLLDLHQRLQKTLNDYELSKQRLEIAQIDLEASQDRSKVTTEQYQNGLVDFDYWNRSQSILTRALTQVLVQKRDWMIAHSNLVKAMGGR